MTTSPWRRLLDGQISRLCVYDIDTREVTVLHETDEHVLEAPNWSVRDDELYVNQNGLMHRIPADGSGALTLVDTGAVTDANNDHVLSPDGATLYLSTAAGEIHAVALDTGETRRVSNPHETPFRYYLHGISPDGVTLSYVGHDVEAGTFDLYLVPAAGGEDTRLTDTRFHHDGVEYAADGSALYFNSDRGSERRGHSQLFRMNPDGSGVVQLTHDERVNWFPHEAPVGGALVYLSYEPGVSGHPANLPVELRLRHEGAGPEVLRSLFGGQGTVNVNSWSPDGRRFGFVEYPVASGS